MSCWLCSYTSSSQPFGSTTFNSRAVQSPFRMLDKIPMAGFLQSAVLGSDLNGPKRLREGENASSSSIKTNHIVTTSLQYNKHNLTFILPRTPGSPNELVLPQSQLAWFIEQPESVLSTTAAHYRQLAGAYAFQDHRVMTEVYQEHVVHKLLQRNVNSCCRTFGRHHDHLGRAAGRGAWGLEGCQILEHGVQHDAANRAHDVCQQARVPHP
ncbi:hypothetical protein IWX90DRAFT_446758 [Phyllosticta citrichinensis]|uniref:Uncharacterized protein n=1 Tax=Phyllosticta citrichinensis TaxID=1130410 RepID=A0ABR1XEH8_9PEZI